MKDKVNNAMHEALEEAQFSPDPSTQNGAVILNADGEWLASDCNHFPLGVRYTDERWERPLKYKYVEHAERNAIYQAAKYGMPTEAAIMVCPWAACSDCARAIVQAGIATLYRLPTNNEVTAAHWHEDCLIGDTIMQEGGVEIIDLDPNGVADFEGTLRRNGMAWTPGVTV